jgi:hypothetical protein
MPIDVKVSLSIIHIFILCSDVNFSLPTNTYAYSLFRYPTSFLRFGLLGRFHLAKLGKKLELASQPKLNSNL